MTTFQSTRAVLCNRAYGIYGSPVMSLIQTVLLLTCVKFVSLEVFSSTASLKTLVNNEKWLLNQLEQYVAAEEKRLTTIKIEMKALLRLANLRHEISEDAWNDHVTTLVDHPMSAYNVIKSWFHLAQLATTTSTKGFAEITDAARERGISLPESNDYDGAIAALVRLQTTYNLPTAELAEGRVHNRTAAHRLDHNDYLAMARTLMDVDHSLAMSWLDLLLEDLDNDTSTELQIYEDKLTIYIQCGDWEKAALCAHRLVQLDPENPQRARDLSDMQLKLQQERARGRPAGRQHRYWKSAQERRLEYYASLCRGDDIKNTIFQNKDLICIYKRGFLPYIRYKEEIHSFSPRISLFIDTISDKQAEMMQTKAFPLLYRAHVGVPSNSNASGVRVSKISWLWDTDPEVAEISKRVSDITGLETAYSDYLSNSEPFQIVNYGLAGQYEPHWDFFEDDMRGSLPRFLANNVDRVATFMYYLSDVQAGGATVFPEIGVRIPPIKYASAFWYNFQLSKMEGDRRTQHAGCPVLLGQKWVANKWIWQGGQIFRRPCGLDIDQVDPIWSTGPT